MSELKTVIIKNRVAVLAKEGNRFIPVYVYWGDGNFDEKTKDWIERHPTEESIRHAINDAIECDFDFMYPEFVETIGE